MGDECLSGLHLTFEIDKEEGQTNCEQIFGCLVITARMGIYLCPAFNFSNFTIKLLPGCCIHRVLYSLSEITKL